MFGIYQLATVDNTPTCHNISPSIWLAMCTVRQTNMVLSENKLLSLGGIKCIFRWTKKYLFQTVTILSPIWLWSGSRVYNTERTMALNRSALKQQVWYVDFKQFWATPVSGPAVKELMIQRCGVCCKPDGSAHLNAKVVLFSWLN